MSTLHPDEALYSLLCKYLLNEADALERQWVEAWREGNAANEAVLNGVRQMLNAPMPAQFGDQAIDTEASWQRLANTIQSAKAEAPVYTLPEAKKPRFRWMQAAAIIIILGGGLTWALLKKNDSAVLAFSGPLEHRLPDGSTVRLDSLAELTVDKDFGKNSRKVYLKGKAFFDIAPNEQQPFEVGMNKDMMVRVLGTRFTIDNRENTPLNIHVESGKILVINSKENKSEVLTQGMLLHQQAQNLKPVIVDNVVDVDDKELTFNDDPLDEVLETVEVVYDVKFELADTSLMKNAVKANFSKAPIEDVLSALSFMTNTTIEKTGPRSYKITKIQ